MLPQLKPQITFVKENMEKLIKNKNILITGGAGFIGSNLCDFLSNDNNVTSLDNYIMGSESNHVTGVKYIKGNSKDLKEIFPNIKFDNIFHFGEYSRVEQSLGEPAKAFDNGLFTFPNVLDFCVETGAKLTYSASSTKFADNGTGSSLSPYTFFKACNSELVQHYHKWYGLNYTTVYFYNAYGPNEISTGKYATLIGKYKELLKQGKKTLPVSKPGVQKRNFTDVTDIVSGIIIATQFGTGDGYGIGADEAYSVSEVCKMFGCEPDFYETNSANRISAPVNTKKIKALGWKQECQLGDHIREFLKELGDNGI